MNDTSSSTPPSRAMAEADLGNAASYASPTDDCDLIMKGGITSGMVYPLAACRLATRYRFRQVGGASAGAIAAALTAAAEYQRRTTTPEPVRADTAVDPAHAVGFVALAQIPERLGRTLATLFQPAKVLRRPFEAFTTWIEPGWSTPKRILTTIRHLIGGSPLAFAAVLLVSLVPGFLIGLWLVEEPRNAADWARVLLSLLAWLPGAFVLAVLVAAALMAKDTLNKLPQNGYGFVRGLSEDPGAPPPLTDWLAEWLDLVAGLTPEEGPLTFGHLYGENASTVFRELKLDEAAAPESPITRRRFAPELDLQMMTCCLSLGRPYAFPFRTKVFHYCPECWRHYFPPAIMAALTEKSTVASEKTQVVAGVRTLINQQCPRHRVPVLRLPPAPDIPVVIGVRLSLSFPGLISGVPFWCVDFTRAEGKKQLTEMWFSDGGITNNFPVHFFDTLLPSRPTLGINLAQRHQDFPDRRVWRPTTNVSGMLPQPRPITSMVSFLGAVANTMHNWVDGMAVSAPGFRDRIVELRTAKDEGGLNLKMTPPTIAALSQRGDEAAQEFENFDFDNHRWVRYRSAYASLSEALDSVGLAYPDYREFAAHYDGGAYGLTKAQRETNLSAADQLDATITAWRDSGYPATAGNLPDPRPTLRSVINP